MRSRNDQYISDSGQHKDGNGIIYHRFVEDRKHLLAYALGYGVKAGAASAGEYNSFHNNGLKILTSLRSSE